MTNGGFVIPLWYVLVNIILWLDVKRGHTLLGTSVNYNAGIFLMDHILPNDSDPVTYYFQEVKNILTGTNVCWTLMTLQAILRCYSSFGSK